MSETVPVSGKCLCGGITFTADADPNVGACHCGMCRGWGGGPLLALDCKQTVRFDGVEPAVYDSSPWAERGFCSRCGTHLFWRLKSTGQTMLALGVLGDGDPRFVVDHQVFIDKKPASYAFAGETKDMTEADSMAMFGGGG